MQHTLSFNLPSYNVCFGPWSSKFSCIIPMSPPSVTWTFAISNSGASSAVLELRPGSCTRTRLELEFSTIEAISNDGENWIALIWKADLILTHARPCCEGVSQIGAALRLGANCKPPIANEGEPPAKGFCC